MMMSYAEVSDYEKYVFSGKTLQKILMNDLGVPVAY